MEFAGVLRGLSGHPETVDAMKAVALRKAEAFNIDRFLDWIAAHLDV